MLLWFCFRRVNYCFDNSFSSFKLVMNSPSERDKIYITLNYNIKNAKKTRTEKAYR
jgi:hypothetical protein